MATANERLKRKQYKNVLRELKVELCALRDAQGRRFIPTKY